MAPHIATNLTAAKKDKARGPKNNNKDHFSTPKAAAKAAAKKACGTSKNEENKENAGVHLVYHLRAGEVLYVDMAKALATEVHTFSSRPQAPARKVLEEEMYPKTTETPRKAPRVRRRSTTRPKEEENKKSVTFATKTSIHYIGRTAADVEARRGWEPVPRKPSPAPRKPSVFDFGWGLFDKARKLATSFVTSLCDVAGRAYEAAEDTTVYAMLLGLTSVRLVREAVQGAAAKAAALCTKALNIPVSPAAGACDAVEGAATFVVRMGLTGVFLTRQAVSHAVSRVPILSLLGWSN